MQTWARDHNGVSLFCFGKATEAHTCTMPQGVCDKGSQQLDWLAYTLHSQIEDWLHLIWLGSKKKILLAIIYTFEILEVGFGMVFRCASFWFEPWAQKWAPGPNVDPKTRTNFWAWAR